MECIDKKLLIDHLEKENKFEELLKEIKDGKFDLKDYESMAKSFVGKDINDFFCNGFFGSSTYDLAGAEITRVYKSDSDGIIIEVRKTNDSYDYGYFDDGWENWKTVYELINEWVYGTEN